MPRANRHFLFVLVRSGAILIAAIVSLRHQRGFLLKFSRDRDDYLHSKTRTPLRGPLQYRKWPSKAE